MNLVIAFLSAVSVTGLASISSIASASNDYSDIAAAEEQFKVLATVAAVEGY